MRWNKACTSIILILCLIILNSGLETKQYKRIDISDHKVIDELILPKTLIECCNGCMLYKECRGVIFDGSKCTRLCNFTPKDDQEFSDQEMKAWIDYSLFQSNILFHLKFELQYLFYILIFSRKHFPFGPIIYNYKK